MSKTTAQLAARVLRKMGKLDAIESPAAADESYVVEVYTDKHAEWDDRGGGLVYWPVAEIPEAIFEALVDLIINQVRPTFGEPMSAADQLAIEDLLLRRIRRHGEVRSADLPVRTDYF